MRCLLSNAFRRHTPDSVITSGLRIVAFAGTLMGCGTGLAADTPSPSPPSALPLVAMSAPDTPDAIAVVAAGDIMPGSITPISFIPAPTDHDIPSSIRGIVGQADVVFGNLEGAFTTEGLTPTKCRPAARDAHRCFEFGSPPFLASFLRDAGFTVLSLDNNHAEDYGLEGYAFTQGLLAQTGITAAPKRTPVALTIRDLRVAIVPFGFSGQSFHISDIPTAQAVVSEAARTADIVIVSFHGGAEGAGATRVRNELETYLEENRGNVVAFAHAAVDAGADLVLGHGPHVPRAIELYQDRLIAYSLGNFWTYGNISITGNKGIMPLLRVTLRHNGEFESGQIVSMRQRLPGIPELDPEGLAAQLIATLSREDFPLNPIGLDQFGAIVRQTTQDPIGPP